MGKCIIVILLALTALGHERPTFDQRWAPVRDIYQGRKSDRLDRRPPAGPHYNWGANPYVRTFRIV